MNVLIFVMTMLMMLSLMTYARLETFRSSQAFQMIFKHYMQEDERGYINLQAEKTYKEVKVSEKDGKARKKIDASPRMSIGLFFDSNREEKLKEWMQTKVLFKNLIKVLYAKQPFYIKIEKERPSFIDDLIRSMTQTIDGLSKEKKPKAPSDLANIKLDDPLLDSALYKMLHGAVYDNVSEQEKVLVKKDKIQDEESETSVDDDDLSNEVAEFKSPEGYYSLLDFITGSAKPKVRIYLASREVLQAIFHEPTIVESIIEEREQLYRQTISEVNIDQLDDNFKNKFLKMKDPMIDDETLDFSVSKTNPKYYR